MRILGIDPGIRNTGWGVIEQKDNRLSHIANGVIKPNPDVPDADRLHHIANGLSEVITTFQPEWAGIEEIFVAKSAASALKLGMARGVALMKCGQSALPVIEIAARRVKKAVTGTGNADKVQMQDMVERLLGIRAANADAADALAIAIAVGNAVTPYDKNLTGNEVGAGLMSEPKNGPDTGPDTGPDLGLGSGLSAAIERALARDAREGSK